MARTSGGAAEPEWAQQSAYVSGRTRKGMICGTNHAFTPIVVEAVPRKNYGSRVSPLEGAGAILISSPHEGPLALMEKQPSGGAGASGPSSPESPSASTGGSTSLAGHPSGETDSDKEDFFTPKSEPDSDESGASAWWDIVANDNEKVEWADKIVSVFYKQLDHFDHKGIYSKIPEKDLICFFHLDHPGCTKGNLHFIHENLSKPWKTENTLFPRIKVFLQKYERNIGP